MNYRPSGIFACLLLAFAVATTASHGAVERMPQEFTGDSVETWERFGRIGPLIQVPLRIFGTNATIVGQHEYTWNTCLGLGDPYFGCFGLGPFSARAHDGTNGYGSSISPGTTRIDFFVPVYQFGGFWASALPARPMTFQFYDSQGTLIGIDTHLYPATSNNGTLEWAGWRSQVPIARIDYTGSWIVNDALRITTMPESASDSDHDGVLDFDDACPNTPPGGMVNVQGCSIAQLVPCGGPAGGGRWRNHGHYVAAIRKTVRQFEAAGRISARQAGKIVAAAARSRCGKK